jgi:hypothetical protein
MRVDPKTYRPGRGKGKRRPPPRPGTTISTAPGGLTPSSGVRVKKTPAAKRTLRKRLTNKGQTSLPTAKRTLKRRLGSSQKIRASAKAKFDDRLANVRAKATAASVSGGRTPTKPTAKSGQAQPYRKAQVGTAVKPRSRTAALSAMRRGKPRYSPNPAASRNAATKRATAQRRKKRR